MPRTNQAIFSCFFVSARYYLCKVLILFIKIIGMACATVSLKTKGKNMTLSLQTPSTDMELFQPVVSVRSGERNGLSNTDSHDHTAFGKMLNEKQTAITEAGREQTPSTTKHVSRKAKGESLPHLTSDDSADDSSKEIDMGAAPVSPDTLKRQAVAWIELHSSGMEKAIPAISSSDEVGNSQRRVASAATSEQPNSRIAKNTKIGMGSVLSSNIHSNIDGTSTGSVPEFSPTQKDGTAPQEAETLSLAQNARIASVLESEPLNGQGIPVNSIMESVKYSTDPKEQDAKELLKTVNPAADILPDGSGTKTGVMNQNSIRIAGKKLPDVTTLKRYDHTNIDMRNPLPDGKGKGESIPDARLDAYSEEPHLTKGSDNSDWLPKAAPSRNGGQPAKQDIDKTQHDVTRSQEAFPLSGRNGGLISSDAMAQSQNDHAVSQLSGAQSAAAAKKSASSLTSDTTKKKSSPREIALPVYGSEETTLDAGPQKDALVTDFRGTGSTEDHAVQTLTSETEKEAIKITDQKTRGTERAADLSVMESLNAVSTFHEQVTAATDGSARLDADAIINQIADAKPHINKDTSRVKITLNPPDLGTVDLEIVVRKNRIEVIMTADHSGVQQILQSHVEDIKSALQRQDMTIDSFQVYLQTNSDGSGRQPNQWAAMYDHRRGGNTENTGNEISPDISPISGNRPHEQHSGLLSVFV